MNCPGDWPKVQLIPSTPGVGLYAHNYDQSNQSQSGTTVEVQWALLPVGSLGSACEGATHVVGKGEFHITPGDVTTVQSTTRVKQVVVGTGEVKEFDAADFGLGCDGKPIPIPPPPL